MENQISNIDQLNNDLENQLKVPGSNDEVLAIFIPENYNLTTTTTVYQPPVPPKNIIIGRIKL